MYLKFLYLVFNLSFKLSSMSEVIAAPPQTMYSTLDRSYSSAVGFFNRNFTIDGGNSKRFICEKRDYYFNLCIHLRRERLVLFMSNSVLCLVDLESTDDRCPIAKGRKMLSDLTNGAHIVSKIESFDSLTHWMDHKLSKISREK